MANSQSSLTDELIRIQIPSWTQLFGQNSQCACDECESMTGAPAYLAQTLHFAEHCMPNSNNETPYDILVKRVPYLPHLPLTCENTNREIPYIRVVLEILEFYAVHEKLNGIPAYDSGSEDWKTGYETISRKAYEILSTQCYPFSLPYHQPLDVIRTYLSNIHTSVSELLTSFNPSASDHDLRMLKEHFEFSDEEYALLTEFKIGEASLDVFKLYGFETQADFEAALFGNKGVGEFLSNTGVLYRELIDILKMSFVNPGNNSVTLIQNLFTGATLPGKSIFSTLQEIRNTAIDDTFDAVLRIKIQGLLQESQNPALDPMLFKRWLDQRFDSFQHTMIIIPDADDPCNYGNAKLSTILASYDDTVEKPVSDDQFRRLYLVVRLLKKTGLTTDDLDTMVIPANGKPNAAVVGVLYASQMLMQRLQLTARQSASLNGNMDVGHQSTYAELFLKDNLKTINAAFRPDTLGNILADVPLRTASQYNEVLMNALSLTSGELDSIVQHLGIVDPTAFKLSLESVSVFYSYALLSRSMRMSVTDLLHMLAAYGNRSVLRTWDHANSKFLDSDTRAQLSFVDFIERVRESGFTVSEFLFVVGISVANTITDKISDQVLREAILSLQAAFSIIDRQHPAPGEDEVDENFVKSELLAIYSKDVVGQLAGMLGGTIVYGVVLPDKPDLHIPTDLQPKVTYNRETGRLEVKGVLGINDWNLMPDGSDLKNRLQPIFEKPFLFLKDKFSNFIMTDQDRNMLLDRVSTQPAPVAVKLKTFYNLLRPHLLKELKGALILQKIAALISLDLGLTRIITRPLADSLYQSITTIAAEASVTADYFPETPLADLRKTVVSLYKASVFISGFGLTADEVRYFADRSADFSNINFSTFTVEQWRRINTYVQLKKFNKSSLVSFLDIFRLEPSTVSLKDVINYILVATGWNKADLEDLIQACGYTTNDFRNEKALFELAQMMKVVSKTSVKGSELVKWSRADLKFETLVSLANEIREWVLLQYEIGQKVSNDEAISEKLLERQRNALVDYILTLHEIKKQGIRNVEELCGHFLIDVPMSSRMKTTRIRQAISSCQSFFKRCQMGIESVKDASGNEVGVLPEYIDNKVWEPKSFFRTWQVTMQFMTNPYPYLSYKYLVDKSGAARALEARLRKSDIIERNVEEAYRLYLQEVNETSNMEIAAMYIDDSVNVDGDSSTKFIHVIGKTRSTPHAYYYSTKNESDRWSFWEKIPVPIKENDSAGNHRSGAHLIFTRFRGRYYLFMPEFILRGEAKDYGSETPKTQSTLPTSSLAASSFWEIKIAVSEYDHGNWGAKQYLQPSGSLNLFRSIKNPVGNYLFTQKTEVDADGRDTLVLSLIDSNGVGVMSFSFKSLHAAIVIGGGVGNITKPPQGVFYQNLRMRQLNYPMPADNGIPANATPDILKEMRREKLLSFSPQYLQGLTSIYDQPFFIHDSDRSYYVKTVPIDFPVNYTYEETDNHYLNKFSDITVATLQHPGLVSFLPISLYSK